MKKTLLFILCAYLILPLYAQEIYSLDSIYSYSPAADIYSSESISATAFTYDSMGRVESARQYDSEYGEPLTHIYNMTINYTADGSHSEIYQYDSSTDSFEPSQGFNVMYNESGDTTLLEESVWFEDDWLVYDKTEKEYDANGNLSFSSNYELDYSSMEWELWSVVSYTYDLDNRLESRTRVIYPSPNYIYMDSRTIYSYDGSVTTATNHNWDSTLEEWKPESRNVHTYNGLLLLESYYQVYYESSDTWSDPDYETVYSYDGDDNLLSIVESNSSQIFMHEAAEGSITVLPYIPYVGGEWNQHFNNARLTTKQRFTSFGNDDILDNEEYYFYSEYDGSVSTDVEEINHSLVQNFLVFPNPASHVLYVNSYKEINQMVNNKVIDINGKVHSLPAEVDKIDISSLPVGPYIIIVEKENGVRKKSSFIKE